jgi:hypothetical protein
LSEELEFTYNDIAVMAKVLQEGTDEITIDGLGRFRIEDNDQDRR